MTTIAVKDGVIACDSMMGISSEGGGDRYYNHCSKIYPIDGDDGKEFIGGSGDSMGIAMWIRWYFEGCDDPALEKRIWKDTDIDIVILHEDGRVQYSDSSCHIEDLTEPFYAIGSGTKCALAAMHCGKSALEAVEIAKKIDPHTGGKVQVFSHG